MKLIFFIWKFFGNIDNFLIHRCLVYNQYKIVGRKTNNKILKFTVQGPLESDAILCFKAYVIWHLFTDSVNCICVLGLFHKDKFPCHTSILYCFPEYQNILRNGCLSYSPKSPDSHSKWGICFFSGYWTFLSSCSLFFIHKSLCCSSDSYFLVSVTSASWRNFCAVHGKEKTNRSIFLRYRTYLN